MTFVYLCLAYLNLAQIQSIEDTLFRSEGTKAWRVVGRFLQGFNASLFIFGLILAGQAIEKGGLT